MLISETYSHLDAKEKLQEKKVIFNEVEKILNDSTLKFGKDKPAKIRKKINEGFNLKGWTDKARVGNTKLTISYLKEKTGICFQLGNVARTYADILKLSHLFQKRAIDWAIMIVPHSLESKKMGKNHARYERLTKEIQEFKEIIKVPILVLGLSN